MRIPSGCLPTALHLGWLLLSDISKEPSPKSDSSGSLAGSVSSPPPRFPRTHVSALIAAVDRVKVLRWQFEGKTRAAKER